MTYAENTAVPVDRSRAEISTMMRKAGAARIATMEEPEGIHLAFEIDGRRIRISMPTPAADEFINTPAGKKRTKAQQDTALNKAERSRWRALFLVIKAKLEAIEIGITTFEREFLADIALPSGRTVSQEIAPTIADHYAGSSVPLLPGPSSSSRMER